MAHFNIIEEEEQKKQLLEELYKLNDEFNEFVQTMDIKLDRVIGKMESLYEDENI